MNAKFWLLVLASCVLFAAPTKADMSGGGSSAVGPVMSLWAQTYKQKTGVAVNYQPLGSGFGVHQMLSRTIDFGCTDMPLTETDLAKGKLVQFPILFLAVVPVVNLPGIEPGALTLDGATLADIFLGKIARWDAPEIARLNPGLVLPKLPIIVVHRPDASGTTFQFTTFLAAVSPAWKNTVGAGTAVDWPTGSAGKGSGGVIAVVKQTRGAIGYAEYAYAVQNGLTFTSLINRDGGRVVPGMASFRAAAAVADFSRSDSPVPANPPGRDSWPLTAATYMLLHADDPPARNQEIVRFLDYALHDGRAVADRLGYVPLPEPVTKDVEALWASRLGVRP